MRSFLKIFLASFLALVVFVFIGFFFLAGYVGGILSSIIKSGRRRRFTMRCLLLDLSQNFSEKVTTDPLAGFSESVYNTPGVYDVVRMIHYAKTDSAVKGIYIKANSNGNGLGTSEEIRNALRDFKRSGKFIYAYGDVISLKGILRGQCR